MAEDICHHDEDTLVKVKEALKEVHYGEYQIEQIINALLNKGILFRERLPYI